VTDPLRAALKEAKRRVIELQDHTNAQPWDNAYVRGYNAATGNAIAHFDSDAVRAALASSPGVAEEGLAMLDVRQLAKSFAAHDYLHDGVTVHRPRCLCGWSLNEYEEPDKALYDWAIHAAIAARDWLVTQ
jgi:hypothetical protein